MCIPGSPRRTILAMSLWETATKSLNTTCLISLENVLRAFLSSPLYELFNVFFISHSFDCLIIVADTLITFSTLTFKHQWQLLKPNLLWDIYRWVLVTSCDYIYTVWPCYSCLCSFETQFIYISYPRVR